MATFNSIKNNFVSRPVLHSTFGRSAQGGVVLIIVLILLVVISMLAVTSMSNAGSTEKVMANVRTTELATQAAEIALRFCEAIANVDASPTNTVKKSISTENWKSLARWDISRQPNDIRVLSLTAVNTTVGISTYKRPPECMLERISTASDIYLVTARGFGPEVAAYEYDPDNSAPQGTEVWLQSQVEFKINTGVSP